MVGLAPLWARVSAWIHRLRSARHVHKLAEAAEAFCSTRKCRDGSWDIDRLPKWLTVHKPAAVFGLVIFLACIISSPCNEWPAACANA
eukprot:6487946-Amphidinium_carterae.1